MHNSKTKTLNESTLVLINLDFEHQFDNNGPKIEASGQVYICSEGQKWTIDVVEVLEIKRVQMFGVEIIDKHKLKDTIQHFKSMGIDLYEEAQKILDEIVTFSGSPKNFVLEQTGIKLP